MKRYDNVKVSPGSTTTLNQAGPANLDLTNTPNFSNVMSTNFGSPGFGKITSTRDNPNDPREIQLALKFYW